VQEQILMGQQSAIESIAEIEKCWIEIPRWFLSPEWVVVPVQVLPSNCTIS
jgi:hypothetical protein